MGPIMKVVSFEPTSVAFHRLPTGGGAGHVAEQFAQWPAAKLCWRWAEPFIFPGR
jgi:hypothetical protein